MRKDTITTLIDEFSTAIQDVLENVPAEKKPALMGQMMTYKSIVESATNQLRHEGSITDNIKRHFNEYLGSNTFTIPQEHKSASDALYTDFVTKIGPKVNKTSVTNHHKVGIY